MIDYIRKAVELADGFRRRGHMVMVYGETRMWLNNPHQLYLDALAAQLVRQVDALPNLFVYTWPERSSVVVEGRDLQHPETTKGSCDGPDRTLNTIKAIVDSKVLE